MYRNEIYNLPYTLNFIALDTEYEFSCVMRSWIPSNSFFEQEHNISTSTTTIVTT